MLEPRSGFRPRERGALPFAVDGRFAPGGEEIQPLLGLATGARVLRMHVEAVAAAVDLRCADLHELEQCGLEARAIDGGAEAKHRLEGIAVLCGIEGQSGLHLSHLLALISIAPRRRAALDLCYSRLSLRRSQRRSI